MFHCQLCDKDVEHGHVCDRTPDPKFQPISTEFQPRDPKEVLIELRKRSRDLLHLSLTCVAARTLAEWSDAQDAMASIMEQAGDLLDQVDSVHLGFVNDRRRVIPANDLIARGKRLESELHHLCRVERSVLDEEAPR